MTNTKKNRLAANKSNSESTNGSGHELKLIVTEGLTVTIRPNPNHEFLMTSKEVAIGYGASEYALRKVKLRNEEDLIEGKHFVMGGTICPSHPNIHPNQVFWTKRGVVRMGMFVKTPRARMFRDWAEDLIIEKMDASTGSATVVPVTKQIEGKRKHNRLTSERMISILQDVCMIEDSELRVKIASKLKGNA